jgi:hypothetical protein
LFLPDDVLIEEDLDFLRLGKLVGNRRLGSGGAIVFEDRIADRNALVTDVSAGIVTRRGDQLGDCVLRLVAKRTAQDLVGTRSVFHSA